MKSFRELPKAEEYCSQAGMTLVELGDIYYVRKFNSDEVDLIRFRAIPTTLVVKNLKLSEQSKIIQLSNEGKTPFEISQLTAKDINLVKALLVKVSSAPRFLPEMEAQIKALFPIVSSEASKVYFFWTKSIFSHAAKTYHFIQLAPYQNQMMILSSFSPGMAGGKGNEAVCKGL